MSAGSELKKRTIRETIGYKDILTLKVKLLNYKRYIDTTRRIGIKPAKSHCIQYQAQSFVQDKFSMSVLTRKTAIYI